MKAQREGHKHAEDGRKTGRQVELEGGTHSHKSPCSLKQKF
jgi:hypothetical protein